MARVTVSFCMNFKCPFLFYFPTNIFVLTIGPTKHCKYESKFKIIFLGGEGGGGEGAEWGEGEGGLSK